MPRKPGPEHVFGYEVDPGPNAYNTQTLPSANRQYMDEEAKRVASDSGNGPDYAQRVMAEKPHPNLGVNEGSATHSVHAIETRMAPLKSK